MSDPMAVFQFVGQTVQNATDAFVTPAASQLIFALKLTALAGMGLYFTLMGYSIATGAVQESFYTFLKSCIKVIIIAAFALNVDTYTTWVMGGFHGLQSGLVQAMDTSGSATSGPQSIYKTLDDSFNGGMALVRSAFQNADAAGWRHMGTCIGWDIAGLVVAAGVVVMLLLGGAVVIVAQFGLAIMLAVGPLFIMCLMWPVTARFFDAWFGQCLNYVLTVVFISIVMSFAMSAFNAFIAGAHFGDPGDQNPMFAALQIGAVTGIFCWIILQVPAKAAALAGGMSMAAMTLRHLASPVAAGSRLTKNAGNLLNPTSTRRDLQSGMMATGTRMDHLMAGNTVLNPAYRQAIRENIGRNWASKRGGKVSGS